MHNSQQAHHGVGPAVDARPDIELSAEELAQRHGGYWGQHPAVPVADWQYEIANGDTRRGYWEHVLAALEQDVA